MIEKSRRTLGFLLLVRYIPFPFPFDPSPSSPLLTQRTHRISHSPSQTLVIILAVEDAQDGQEQVDNVKVQTNRGGDLLLDVVLAHNELGVDEDVAAEDQSTEQAPDELGGAAVGEEHGHEPEQDQAPKGAEEVGHPRGKVVLGLAGEGREKDEDAGRQDGGVENDGGLIEGDDDGYGVSLEEGEPAEEDQVGGVGLALPVGQAEEDHGADEGDPDKERVALDPLLVALAEEADGADDGGRDELDGEDRVDLADELVADVEAGFGDGASEFEVVGDVVVVETAARDTAAKETLGVLSSAILGLVRWGRLRVLGVLLRSRGVFGRARHLIR